MHKMLRNKEAVIFDLDGTLVDSMWIWKAIDIEYLGRFGIALPPDLQSRIEGMSFDETAVFFKKEFHIPQTLDEIKQTWNEMAMDYYLNKVTLKEGIKELLEYCHLHSIKLGIATSNSKELMSAIANVHGFNKYFSCIMTGSDIIKGKPAPDIYLSVASKLNVAPDKCLVFEDIIPGIQAGISAGMTVCAVEDAYSADKREEKEKAADYYINSFTELFIDA